jgi:hypothetical protein
MAQAALKARNGKLSVGATRKMRQGVSDVFTAANIESLSSASIKSWCEAWTQTKAIETEESTHARYNRMIEQFTGFIRSGQQPRPRHTPSPPRARFPAPLRMTVTTLGIDSGCDVSNEVRQDHQPF